MKKQPLNSFAIIGAGMVGTAIGFLLKKAGYKITAIADKSPAALKRAQAYIGGESFRNPQEAVQRADCILITTPDDKISSACREIALCPAIKNKLVFHMSGAGDLDILDSAKKREHQWAVFTLYRAFLQLIRLLKTFPAVTLLSHRIIKHRPRQKILFAI